MRSPVVLGRCTSSTRLGWPSAGASTSVDSSSRAALGSALVASRSMSRTITFWPCEAPGQELCLEPHRVVDEHDIVDQQLRQLQVAGGLGAAQADCEQGNALPRRRARRPWPAVRPRWSGRRRGARSPREAHRGARSRPAAWRPQARSGCRSPRTCAACSAAGMISAGRSTSASSRAEFETR